MKKVIGALLMAGVIFAGCGISGVGPSIAPSVNPLSDEAAKELGEKMAEDMLGGIDIEYAEEGTGEVIAWPKQIPSDVPVFKYGKLDASIANPNGEGSKDMAMIQISGISADGYAKYEQDLKAAGWTITTNSEYADSQMSAEKGTTTVSIDKNPMGDGTAFFYYMPQ